MMQMPVRELTQEEKPAKAAKPAPPVLPVVKFNSKPRFALKKVQEKPRVQPIPKEDIQIGETKRREAEKRVEEGRKDPRFQREREEMKETTDLSQVDDDVEAAATLYEWRAEEFVHRPKSPAWFMAFAAGATLLAGLQVILLANLFGALTIGLIAAMTYYIAQQRPQVSRYRIMIDGIAINNSLYHYRDLESFNVIYIPEGTKTVIFKSKSRFSPHIHLEIGESDANPLTIRDMLLEYLPEDAEMEEPLADVLARRLGF